MSETSRNGYSNVARWLHWLIALVVVLLIPMGLVMTRLQPGQTQDRLFELHESLGLTALGLMFFRVVTRLRSAPAPASHLTPLELRLSLGVHRTLYILLLLTPVIGWFGVSAFGLGPSFFGTQLPALIVKNEGLAEILFVAHLVAALLIAALVSVHVAAALRHVARKDGVFSRIWLFSGSR